MAQLSVILKDLYKNNSPANILIRGASGWGKTRMALQIANYLSGENFQFMLADSKPFNSNFRVHVIDEIHLVKEPEIFYPLMDTKKYVIIFTTNDVSVLAEALSNRCIDFVLEPYSISELRAIARENLWSPLDDQSLDLVIKAANNNPRIIISVLYRINLYQRDIEVVRNVEHMKIVLEKLMGVVKDLDEISRRYLFILKKLGGSAALDTMARLLHANKDVLKATIEPHLLEEGYIKITSKGRVLS